MKTQTITHSSAPSEQSEHLTFNNFGLDPLVFKAIQALGFEKPTGIQAQAIPLLMQGRDLIGSAQTGTGKTAAFALPILTQLRSHGPRPGALILVPTRELAGQVEAAIKSFSKYTTLRTAVLYGGVGYGKQLSDLRKGVDIIVATPGRLLDHMERKTVDLGDIQFLVLDEADRMLDMGFLPDVKLILTKVPKDRQTALFSATIPPQIETLTTWAMKAPVLVQIGQRRSPAETVRHVVYPVADSQKLDLLKKLLDTVHYQSVIVFCRTKHRADFIAQVLNRTGHTVAVLHSNRTQREREAALTGFRSGKFEVLVATDIAARGLDVADVSHVINYDVPQHPEDYVHRIGRTGRAEEKGEAFTLMVAEDSNHVRAVERFIGQKIVKEKLQDFDYQYTALFDEGKPNQPAGKFRGGRVRGGYFFGKVAGKRRR